MKTNHPALLVAAVAALILATRVQAQTNVVINGTAGTNSTSTSYSTNGGINLSLGFFADYLVVGGGGSGGTAGSVSGTGGGGAGGLLQGNTQLSSSNYSVTVGAGGVAPNTAGSSSVQGVNGTNSVFGNLTAVGGGGGGRFGIQGNSGGSGGGGGGRNNTAGGAGTTSNSIVQGNAGGTARGGNDTGRSGGGGGGGAGSVGGNGAPSSSTAGNGGAGLTNSITGSAVVYAGGGGGGAFDSNSGAGETAGTGGTGGGGAGSTSGNASNGTDGLGGGGGGAGDSGRGGNGGSGVVIVRYQGASLGSIGGTVSTGTGTAAGYTIHTFTNTGGANFNMSGVNLNNRLGATVSGNVTAARVDFNGPGTLTLAGSSNSASSGGLFANTGTVRLTGTMEARNLIIANSSNSTGAVVVDGGVLRGTNSSASIDRTEVGPRGNGSLTLNSGSIASAYTTIGHGSVGTNGSGTVTINGGTWTNSGKLEVGGIGSGTLNVNGGTSSIGGYLIVGRGSFGNGVVNVTGGTLSISSGIYLSLASSPLPATFNISNGGTVMVGGFGFNLDSTNAVLNLGAGGTLQILNGANATLSTRHPAGLEINGDLAFLGSVGSYGRINAALRIGSGGTNGSLSGNLYTTSSVTFDRSDNLTYSGNLYGTTLIKEGDGTLTLSGSNNLSGDTLVNDGTLLLGGANALGSKAVVKVNAGGTIEAGQRVVVGFLDVNGGSVVGSNNLVSALTLVNSGNVAGLADGVDYAAGIIKRTAGVATVDGANTFTGLVRVEAGTLQMTNGGSFASASSLLLSNAATVDLNGVSQQFSSVNGAGSLALGSGTLTVGGSESSDFSGAISGSGAVVKSGSGTMTLSGTSTYSGATTVSGGELVVDGAVNSSAVTVNSGGTLGGSGSVGGQVTVSLGGTLAPGNSPGVLTATNGLSLATGSTFEWEIIGNTASGRGTSFDGVDVTGGNLSIGTGVTSALVFNIGGSTVSWADSFWDANQTWLVFSNANLPTLASGSIFDTISLTADINALQLNDVAGRENASFSWNQVGNDVYLNYNAVPEPSTYALLALAAAGFGAHVLRRRRRK